MLFGEAQTSENQVLNKLEKKFNSGKYDLNAVKEFLFPYMIKHQPIRFTAKRNNNHMCIKTDFLKLLDISNYVAPGFSYDQFLKAYECEQTKGFFPYEWIDSLDKLEETSLSPHEAFYSSLKNTNITDQEYTYCQQVWQENNMITFREFLVWYNNLDVVPFLEAVEKMSTFWQERKIDMFKDGISVPGLTLKYLFSFLDKQTLFLAISIILLKITTWVGLASSFTAITKRKKQDSEKQKEARLLSCVRKSSGMMPMRFTFGSSCRICPREAIQDA